MTDNLPYLFHKFLKSNGYNFSADTISLELNAHPDYPTLNAFDDVLAVLGVEHVTLELPWARIKKIDHDFLIIDSDHSGQESIKLASTVDSETFEFVDVQLNKRSVHKEDMQDDCNRIIVLVEPNTNVKWNIVHFIFKYSWIFLIALVVLLLEFAGVYEDLSLFLFSFFSIVGVYLGISIVSLEIGKSNSLVNTLCSEDNDCSSVLFSKYALVFGFLKLSDLVIVYFISLLVYILCRQPVSIDWAIACATYSAIPFVIYSLFYQYKLSKWCKLCLGTSFTLIILISVVLKSRPLLNSFELKDLFSLILTGFLLLILWVGLRPSFSRIANFDKISYELTSFRRNVLFFLGYINFKQPIEPPENYTSFPELVRSSGYWHLTIVLNPTCTSCRDMWLAIMDLEAQLRCFRGIKVLFSIKEPEMQNHEQKVADVIMHHYHNRPDQKWLELLNEWMAYKDIDLWTSSNDVPDGIGYSDDYKRVYQWSTENFISKTPTVMIDGKALPYLYRAIDLKLLFKNLVSDIVESQGQQSELVVN